MHADVLALIHEYKREMEYLEETIRFVNEKYDDLLDVHFDTLCQVEFFTGVLEVELSNANFFVFEGRCHQTISADEENNTTPKGSIERPNTTAWRTKNIKSNFKAQVDEKK